LAFKIISLAVKLTLHPSKTLSIYGNETKEYALTKNRGKPFKYFQIYYKYNLSRGGSEKNNGMK